MARWNVRTKRGARLSHSSAKCSSVDYKSVIGQLCAELSLSAQSMTASSSETINTLFAAVIFQTSGIKIETEISF